MRAEITMLPLESRVNHVRYNIFMLLLGISFIAGILTVLAPCVLPLLPIIVGGSIAGGGKRRAYTIAISLGVSVVLFTLLLKVSSLFINIPQEAWYIFSGGILIFFGLTMLFPYLWDSLKFVNLLNRQSNKVLAVGYQKNSFWGDVVMGAALGPVFASCSPTYFIILATVLPVSFWMGFLDLTAYAIGLSGTLLVIAFAGQKLVDRLGITIDPSGWFRRGIGLLFLIVGVLIATGVMARVESWLLLRGFDATAIEQRLLGSDMGAVNATSTTFMSPEMKASVYQRAPELLSPSGYINTEGRPITLEELRGKVVLLDIWTYSCINCQRTLPYLKDWYSKYKDQGLEIIGLHTPEFAFEKVKANVEDAAKEFGLTYPIVQDNDYATWRALGNNYWPRKYLIDLDGYIVYDHVGEGAYAETEAAIQRALQERALRLGLTMPGTEASSIPEAPRSQVASPETYFGAWRNEFLGNGTPFTEGVQTFSLPSGFQANTLYFGGQWDLAYEYAKNVSTDAKIVFLYSAKNVYFVARADAPVKIKITRDGGKPLGDARGADVAPDGTVIIQESRLYKLIEDDSSGAHTIEITIETPGLEAYTFTFG